MTALCSTGPLRSTTVHALRPGGALVLEIGWQQRQAVMELLAGNGWADIECRRDYGGNDRCIIAHRPK